MANKIFNSASFSGPKFSYFDMSHPNLVSQKFGECIPVYWDFLNPNDKAVFDMSQVVRVSPMLQPILSQIDITVDAYAVRLRTLGMAERDPWKYEDFFNANKNLDGSFMLPRAKAVDILQANGARLGSLYDHLGFPTFEAFRKDLRRQLSQKPFLMTSSLDFLVFAEEGALVPSVMFAPTGSVDGGNLLLGAGSFDIDAAESFPSVSYATYYNPDNGTGLGHTVAYHLDSTDAEYITIPPLVFYALWVALGSNGSFEDFLVDYISDSQVAYDQDAVALISYYYILTSGHDDLNSLLSVLREKSLPDYIYENFKVDWQSIVEDWFNWIFQHFVILGHGVQKSGSSYVADDWVMLDVFDDLLNDDVGTVQTSSSFNPDSNSVSTDSLSFVPSTSSGHELEFDYPGGSIYTPLYPALSYWKIVSDWYLNTGLFDPDEYFLSKVFKDGDITKGYNLSALFGDAFKRNWSPDYFTSAFDSAQRGLAVGVPADGTIPDLRNATALQKFKERLLFAGHKFRDVIYSIFGIKMSSAIADMSEVLGRWVNPVNIDSTLQTSAGTPDSPLASYAGTGLSFGHKNNILHYVAEEPTVIMFIASIRPKFAIYYQGFPKKLRRNFLMDYAIPGFANVGEQMISNREIYCDANAGDSQVFGFTRRFADFMVAMPECHGDFKDSLDSWHLARQFEESPLLNKQFLSVDGVADNLNRIFATSSDSVDKFYCNYFFNGGIVRSIPKRIYFDL